jgi:negative regulator of replication initiation
MYTYVKKIEIDEDIFNFLKEHAEPLADSPNLVLRRLLIGEKPCLIKAGIYCQDRHVLCWYCKVYCS